MATYENLADAFAGESQANRRYLAFAKKAEAEGHPGIAKIFRAAADGETVHALAHLRVMGGVKSTAENLAAAMEGESQEFKEMYPAYISAAQAEGNKAAEGSFKNAIAVEQVHYSLYSEAAKRLGSGEDMKIGKIFVCQVCGNAFLEETPDKCPVCGAVRSKFNEIA